MVLATTNKKCVRHFKIHNSFLVTDFMTSYLLQASNTMKPTINNDCDLHYDLSSTVYTNTSILQVVEQYCMQMIGIHRYR